MGESHIKILAIGDTPAIHFVIHKLSLLFKGHVKQFSLVCVSLYTMNQTMWVDSCSGEHHLYNVPHVFRSLDHFISSHTQEGVYDIVFLAGTSYPSLKRSLQMLRNYTDKDTVILFDGFLGFSFEPLVYSILPDCICITFFFDVIVKYVVPGYFVYQRLDESQKLVVLNFGYTGIPSNQFSISFDSLKKRSMSYLLLQDTKLDVFIELFTQKLNSHQNVDVFHTKKFINAVNQSVTLDSLIYKNIILRVIGDMFSIVNGQRDFNTILKSSRIKPVLDAVLSELINLLSVNLNITDITCGINPRVNTSKFFKECLLERKNEELKMINPYKGEDYDYTNYHHVSFGYFQRTETHAPIMLFHVLVLSDYAGLCTRSLTFLYTMFVRLAQGDFTFWQSRVQEVPVIPSVQSQSIIINEKINMFKYGTYTTTNIEDSLKSSVPGETKTEKSDRYQGTPLKSINNQSVPPSVVDDIEEFVDAQELALAAADVLAYIEGIEDDRTPIINQNNSSTESKPATSGSVSQNERNLTSSTRDDPNVKRLTPPSISVGKLAFTKEETEKLLLYEDEEREHFVLYSNADPLLRSQPTTTYVDTALIFENKDFVLDSKLIPTNKAPMSVQKHINQMLRTPLSYENSDKGAEVRNRLFEESKKRFTKGLRHPKIPGADLYKQIERREDTLTNFLDDSLGVTTDRYGTAFMFPPSSRKIPKSFEIDHK